MPDSGTASCPGNSPFGRHTTRYQNPWRNGTHFGVTLFGSSLCILMGLGAGPLGSIVTSIPRSLGFLILFGCAVCYRLVTGLSRGGSIWDREQERYSSSLEVLL